MLAPFSQACFESSSILVVKQLKVLALVPDFPFGEQAKLRIRRKLNKLNNLIICLNWKLKDTNFLPVISLCPLQTGFDPFGNCLIQKAMP